MASKFSVSAVFKGIDKISAPMSRMGNAVGKFTSAASKKIDRLNKRLEGVSKTLKKVGTGVGVTAVAGLTATIAGAVQEGIKFEQTLINAGAKFGGIRKGTKDFLILSKAAKQIGKTTEFSAAQAAKGLEFLAMANFSAAQAAKVLPSIVDLATSSNLDLATATDIVSDSLGIFGLQSKNAVQLGKNVARMNDVIAVTANKSNQTVEQMFEVIKSAGKVATTAGLSLEKFASMSAILANEGVKGSIAATGLKSVMLGLAAQTPKAKKLLEKLGVTFKDLKGNLKDPVQIFGELKTAMNKLPKAERVSASATLFGREGLTAAAILIQDGGTALGKFEKKLEKSKGASQSLASVMRDSMGGMVNTMKSGFSVFQLTIFDLLKGPLGALIEKITSVINIMNTWSEKNKVALIVIRDELGNALFNLAKIIGGLIFLFLLYKGILLAVTIAQLAYSVALVAGRVALFAYNVIMKLTVFWSIAVKVAIVAWTAVQWLLNAAIAANPIVAIIILVVAFVAIIALLVLKWGAVKKFFVGLWDSIVSKFWSAVTSIKSAMDFILNPINEVIKSLSAIWKRTKKFFGGGKGKDGDDGESGSNSKSSIIPKVITPQQRTASSIQETRETTTENSTLTIKNEANVQAALKNTSSNQRIKLAESGSF